MRSLVIILIFTVSALSVIPCCAFDNCEQDASHVHKESTQGSDGGLCSPFFSCSTCSGFTPSGSSLTIPANASYITQHYSIFINPFYLSYQGKFWQPPKLT